ncbi:MAG: PAS domain S-box protein [Anaerolineae bacterium]|nr:PAS domain S-box protein [Anaerolineae bacterium]
MDNNEKTREELLAELQEARQQIAELNSIFEVLPDIVFKSDAQGNIEFVSRSLPGLEREQLLGMNTVDLTPPQAREQAIRSLEKLQGGEETYLETEAPGPDGQPSWTGSRTYPIIRDNEVVGGLSVITDITVQKQAEAERARLQEEIIKTQQHAIQELSTPVIPIMDRIIVMPLIGSIDSLRAKDITRNLLAGISQHRAKVVILDVTGVGIVDTGVVNHLNKTIQAARLKGARTIVTGVSDAVAEAIVDLGIDWSEVQTLSDLRTGLTAALASLGLRIEANK